MAQNIRGLTMFITDIRNCKTVDAEKQRVNKELAKIRTSFAKKNVSGYDKKKYVWKIVYMYMLGYDVDFGHQQAVDLLTSKKFSEKNVGYVACGILLIEHTEILRLCIQSIRHDLQSENEVFQSLALHCVANTGGQEFAESLTPDVQRLLLAGHCRNSVRKKSALCLLHMFRKFSEVIPTDNFAPRLVNLMEHRNLGVVTSVLGLIQGLVSMDPSEYGGCVPHAVKLLTRLIMSKECPKDYLYYRTPCPWLQVKLLRLLQYFAPPEDALLERLSQCLEMILKTTEVTKSVNKNNADHAILFEAINLIIHMNMGSQSNLHSQAITLLTKFISVKEPNIRYLGLDSMARLASVPGTIDAIRKHHSSIKFSLKDPDISIRKRALDLMYQMCNEDNAKEIISDLLDHLPHADFDIKEEMVLKIAILAEKFATDRQYYVDSILVIIQDAGDFVTDDVWYRVVQIVTNTEELQEYTANKVYQFMQAPALNETAIKLCGYILGEFGHMLSVSGEDQFRVLHQHFPTMSLPTKALLLSAYMKMANMYDSLQSQVDELFANYGNSADPEIQQRCVEYRAMSGMSDQNLVTAVWEAMPDFPERESMLVKKMKKKKTGGADRDVWTEEKAQEMANKQEEGSDESDEEESEEESEESDEAEEEEKEEVPDSFIPANLLPSNTSQAQFPAQDLSNFSSLLLSESGIMYEHSMLQIGFKHQIEHGFICKLILFYGNKSSSDIVNLTCSVENPTNGLKIQIKPTEPFHVPAKKQVPQYFMIRCQQPFKDCPIIRLHFQQDQIAHEMVLQLPLSITKFTLPLDCDMPKFVEHWKATGNEKQFTLRCKDPINMDNIIEQLSKGMSFHVIRSKQASSVLTVGMFHTASKDRDGNPLNMIELMRVETNAAAQMVRLTVRTGHQLVTLALEAAVRGVWEVES